MKTTTNIKILAAGLLTLALAVPVYAEKQEHDIVVIKNIECGPGSAPHVPMGKEFEGIMEDLHEILGDMDEIDGDRAFMGVLLDDDGGSSERGVELIGVTPGGSAHEAGLKAKDIILAVNGESMARADGKKPNHRLMSVLKQLEIGDAVEVIVDRDGRSKTFNFELGSYKAGHGNVAKVIKEYQFRGSMQPDGGPGEHRFFRHPGKLGGLSLTTINAELGEYFGTAKGLLVLSAPAVEGMGLKSGDVIVAIGGRDPQSPEKAWRIIDSYDHGEVVSMDIMRHQQSMTIEMKRP